MACLRSFSRRSLYPKWFCCKISRPDVLHQHHFKDHSEPSFPDSSLLIRRFHRHVLLDVRKKTAFGSTSKGSSGLLLCRHMSSKPEEFYSKIDAFENVAGEIVSEKTVEAVAATNVSTPAIENFSFPGNLINGIHELTGFDWWITFVLTAVLVNGLMSPVSVRVMRRAWELKILRKAFLLEDQQRKNPDDVQSCLENVVRNVVLMEKYREAYWYFLTFFFLDATIYAFFLDGISTMANKIPQLSTSDSLYILPLITGFTIWLFSESNKSGSKLSSKMMRLPLFPIIFIALQHIFEFKPAVYGFVIPSTIYLSILFQSKSLSLSHCTSSLAILLSLVRAKTLALFLTQIVYKSNDKGMQDYVRGLGSGIKIQKGSIRSIALYFNEWLPTEIVLKINGKDVLPYVRRRKWYQAPKEKIEALMRKMGM